MRTKSKKLDTLLAHAGRDPDKNFGVVNPPVYHASTILHRTVAEYEAAGRNRYNQVTYGRHGTPTTMALVGSGPHSRESAASARLSPMTQTLPCGTILLSGIVE